MELTDSTSDELRDPRTSDAEPTRSVLGIDLNEIPSPAETLPDSFDVVRSYHDNPSPPPGGPAGLPAAARGSCCAACGKPEARGYVVVCDACERGFHLGCARMRGPLVSIMEEWVCGDCECSGVKSKRWPLGKSKRILDMNASPPSDGDGDAEGTEEVLVTRIGDLVCKAFRVYPEEGIFLREGKYCKGPPEPRKHTLGGNSFGGGPFGAPLTYSNFLCTGNGFGFQKTSGLVTHTVKVGIEDILHHTHTMGKNFEEVDLSFPLGRCRSSNNTGIKLSSPSTSDIFLQALRDFVSEKHGELEEGWRVELKQSIGSCEFYAVYCAPDGKTFDSVYEVACYLGLMSKYGSKEPERRSEGCFSISERTNLPRKRKARRFAITNGFAENKETSIGGYCKELSSDGPSLELCSGTFDNNAQFMEAGADESGRSESEQNNGLPVQFEDFFLLSLGKVDSRPSYHDAKFLWPVGFKSCWHDKITGSLFICEVLDGGDDGPVFKVKRCSCSSLPVPYCSTVLFRRNFRQFLSPTDEESDEITGDNDDSIHMILSDPCPPMENDILSCLRSCSSGGGEFQMSTKFQQDCSIHENSENVLSCEMGSIDEIGEFSVEENSLSLAWRMISQKLVNACSEILKRKGTFKFFCKHIVKDGDIPNYVMKNETSKGNFSSLDKLSSSQGCFGIPSVIHSDEEIDTLNDVVEKWLDLDRFGLDVDFVQEILEQLPGVQTCSQYQMLSERSSHSSSVTVGNGLLVPKMRGGLECNEQDTLNGLFRKSKKARLVESHVMDNHYRPPGKRLCSKVPSELVGDVYQVWELLWRFYEILGLEDPLSLEELEEELSNPWFDNSELLEKFEMEIRGSQDINFKRTECTDGHLLSSSSESGLAVSRENGPAFIQMETGAMKEAAQSKLASITYSRSSGVALTKAHYSLLRVLVGELQVKVAALVDPNFDSGESRSKRGRKKDVDSSIFVKRTKLNTLPINELTWPELARRYILAVLSMDGNLDSAEITARESGKVFRCLQGDGGVLCGSLTGVAGMEADALLLAEATKQIFGSVDREDDVLTLEDDEPDATGASEKNLSNDGNTPEWAKVLEPVRKLPTNVGTRIRKCVYEALERDPPEWARKILEHSISKEVYKGNASGPTKKAVLSVLADVCGEGLPPKPDKRKKRKTVIPISDVVMKQCRIVLRRAATADDAKVFCNLLGRKLINSTDNDDEGLLGSPAMVSRPLDFRTIDLRLAAGAYGGLQEAFLEDVRELWSNVRNAFGDQPDLVELAETLSQNFESLYDKEVVSLVNKFAEFAKLDCLNAERRKEIDDLLSSTSLIPKAPWDEGVCKVCGIDRDDDSVLLCDTCDAEYHTYCLNPPLARIPEGNWYCPSCVVGKRMVQDVPENNQVIRQRSGKKYQGEVTRVYLEALAHLAAKMEEKEYWEFTVDERTFILKFLCDELLNSAIIRQHLEQCAETSTELQQKLRSLFVEWKNLKSREETLVARAAKLDPNILKSLGAVDIKESSLANHEKSQSQVLSDRSNYCGISADDLPAPAGGQEGIGQSGSDKCSPVTDSEYNCRNLSDNEVQLKEANASVGESNTITPMDSQKNDKSFGPNELPASNSLAHEVDGSSREICSTGNPQGLMGKCSSSHQPLDGHSDGRSTSLAQHVTPVVVNELQAYHVELNSVKNDIALLEESITGLELELSKVSVRREFLGSDSVGCLYWASGTPMGHSQIIVDGTAAFKNGKKMNGLRGQMSKSSALQSSIQAIVDNHLPSEGSEACYPYQREQNNAVAFHSPWVSYQTDEEINELISCFKNKDAKERELKESILHWQKLRFQEVQKGQSEFASFSATTSGEKGAFSDCLVTKAANLMEKRYGPCIELESTDILKKRGKRARLSSDDKMYRCECLEIIWPCRPHCLSCHRTFLNDIELEGHNEGRCSSALLAHEKGKELTDASKVKGTSKSETSREDCKGEMSRSGIPKPGFSELSAKLIKFRDEGFACPYDFEEICSKFVTQDSCKDLIQEIGLLGLKGIPSFVPSMSPYLSDASLAFVSSHKDVGLRGDGSEAAERPFLLGNANATVSGHDSVSDRSPRRSAAKERNAVVKSQIPALGYVDQRDGVHFSGSHSSVIGVARCCVVPQSSLRPLVGKVSHILRRMKINLLDMDAALPEEALRPSKSNLERRWAWRAFVKSATTIYEMVQATIVLEDMIKTEYLRNEWWYWSSFSAAAKTSTMSSLALRIYSLDAAIVYEKILSDSAPTDNLEPITMSEPKPLPILDPTEKTKITTRRSNKKRKEPEG
ncbi:Methyltransferase [Trema orientale]|uniref:Methyltransferase n=1 Tax=Trema orientale TaxID=63057 RepID=A0A2P5B4S7_TREOI|nr:Methyltransferase [Trema orientale]